MRAAFFTLGCKVNQYETRLLKRLFEDAGFSVAGGCAPGADVYVVAGCTVTAEGDRKSRQTVRRFRRENPGAVIVFTGCGPQAFPERAAALAEADVVTGVLNRARLPALVKEFSRTGRRMVEIPPFPPDQRLEPCEVRDFGGKTRAFLKIQDGCDSRCAYCIIPAARGPVRSKRPDDIRREMRRLVSAGYREVVLVGINLSSYGREWGLRLSDAVEIACGTEGVGRVRLGSVEPDRVTPDEIARLSRLSPGLCPQFHLSLQSGSDSVLARMNRRYRTAEYRAVADAVRAAFPGARLTTDMMVGFPGETEEEHRASLRFAEEIGFAKIHVFPFSPRRGTPAAGMPDPVPGSVRRRRAAELLTLAGRLRLDALRSMIGRTEPVLFEGRETAGSSGHTPNFTPVTVADPPIRPGDLRDVAITGLAPAGDGCVGVLPGGSHGG